MQSTETLNASHTVTDKLNQSQGNISLKLLKHLMQVTDTLKARYKAIEMSVRK